MRVPDHATSHDGKNFEHGRQYFSGADRRHDALLGTGRRIELSSNGHKKAGDAVPDRRGLKRDVLELVGIKPVRETLSARPRAR